MEILAKLDSLNFYRISTEAKIPKGTLADNLPILEEIGLIKVEREEKAKVPGGKKKYYGLTDLGVFYYLFLLLQKQDFSNIQRVIEKYANRFPLVVDNEEEN